MKNQVIILFALLVQVARGQVLVEEDSVLKKIHSELPSGWVIKISNTFMTIEKTDSVWAIITNHINEPGPLPGHKNPTNDELKAKFEKYGHKKKYYLSYRIEQKWNDAKMKGAKRRNDSIRIEIGKFWDKYGIEKFYYRPKNGKGKQWDEARFEPKTKDDTLNLEKYKNEKKPLDNLIIDVPDKFSQKYSLFHSDCYYTIHVNSLHEDVYPKSANTELHQVCEKIYKFCYSH